MREIKFRGWDKIEKKMIPWDLVFEDGISNGVELWKSGNLKNDEYHDIMQYTGIKAENGQEIYEGDIVVNHWYNINGKFIGGRWVVKYGEHSISGFDYYTNYGEGFYFENIKSDSGYETQEQFNISGLPSDDKKGIEILGNIHQDPGLLK